MLSNQTKLKGALHLYFAHLSVLPHERDYKLPREEKDQTFSVAAQTISDVVLKLLCLTPLVRSHLYPSISITCPPEVRVI
jgi:hypothetical protein